MAKLPPPPKKKKKKKKKNPSDLGSSMTLRSCRIHLSPVTQLAEDMHEQKPTALYPVLHPTKSKQKTQLSELHNLKLIL